MPARRRTWPSTRPCSSPGTRSSSLRLDHGGHLTHGLKVNFSGRLYTIAHYGVSRETNVVDYDEVLELAKEHAPRLIVCGGSAYPRTVEADRFREIADEVGAMLLCDMAHFAGLVAAGLHPNPVPHCDFVTSTTHKTLSGPRSGFVLCREEHAQALDRAVFPGMQGGPMEHVIAAKATCFRIAGTPAFRDYQAQVRANADALAAELQARAASTSSPAAPTRTSCSSTSAAPSGPARTPRSGSPRCGSPSTATPSPSTSARRPSPPACGWGRRPARCEASTRRTSARSRAIVADALADDADPAALAARGAALCERRPLYPGFRGYCDLPAGGE